MSKVLLESRWDETKGALLEGLKGNRRSTMGVLLENTKKQLLRLFDRPYDLYFFLQLFSCRALKYYPLLLSTNYGFF